MILLKNRDFIKHDSNFVTMKILTKDKQNLCSKKYEKKIRWRIFINCYLWPSLVINFNLCLFPVHFRVSYCARKLGKNTPLMAYMTISFSTNTFYFLCIFCLYILFRAFFPLTPQNVALKKDKDQLKDSHPRVF